MAMTETTMPAGEAMTRIATANQKLFIAASRATARSAQGVLAAQKRLMDFAARRLRTDLETAAALGRCAKAGEAMTVTRSFCVQAVSDYAAEATEIVRAAASAVSDGAAETRH
jgi:hypothetical protein